MIASQFLQTLILFFICYFYAKKAAHLVEDNAKLRYLLKVVMYLVFASSTFIAAYQIFDTQFNDEKENRLLCHTWYFLINALFN